MTCKLVGLCDSWSTRGSLVPLGIIDFSSRPSKSITVETSIVEVVDALNSSLRQLRVAADLTPVGAISAGVGPLVKALVSIIIDLTAWLRPLLGANHVGEKPIAAILVGEDRDYTRPFSVRD